MYVLDVHGPSYSNSTKVGLTRCCGNVAHQYVYVCNIISLCPTTFDSCVYHVWLHQGGEHFALFVQLKPIRPSRV